MEKTKTLRRYGLFDAKVPRYTSYPPANRFVAGFGQRNQKLWLESLDPTHPVSIYVHIPFCRRICWFCACRTQGTKTLKPVDDYLSSVAQEIAAVAAIAPKGIKMARLHLGGGTPTLLSATQMHKLLSAIHDAFAPSDDFEFSVEIDPTEASDAVLDALADWKLQRASIGVQDFNPKVQKAIGRLQTFGETQEKVDHLRAAGVKSLNIDLLYGLPFQTAESLMETLDRVVALRPDRLALYGYAHVPHVSKRQVMIAADALPDAEARYRIARMASERLVAFGYIPFGIDHFALPHDGLAKAANAGSMKRNFQGYTDDPCDTLIGFGASAISKLPQGYLQNAVSTAAYNERARATGLAAHKGHEMSSTDRIVATLIDQLMCYGAIDFQKAQKDFIDAEVQLHLCQHEIERKYSDVLEKNNRTLKLKHGCLELARVLSAEIDQGLRSEDIHSMAI